MYDLIKCNCSASDFIVVDWVNQKVVKSQNVNEKIYNAMKKELNVFELSWE